MEILARFANTNCSKFIGREYTLNVTHRNGIKVTQLLEQPKENTYTLAYPWKGASIIGERYQKKRLIRLLDFPNYNFRGCFCMEKTKLSEDEMKSVHASPIKYAKLRIRDSYLFNEGIRLDISSFKSAKSIESIEAVGMQYDCEIERVSSPVSLAEAEVSFKSYLAFLMDILKIIQKVPFTLPLEPLISGNVSLLGNGDISEVMTSYAKLTGSSNSRAVFIGVQPETLNLNRLNPDEEYAVTEKLDGIRVLIYIDENGYIYLITGRHSLHIIKLTDSTLGEKSLFNSVLDAELTLNNHIYAFDMIFLNGHDLRGNSSFLLQNRLYYIAELTKCINSNGSQWTCYLKPYFFGDVFNNMMSLMERQCCNISDGVIIVPLYSPYPKPGDKNEVPLKWKPLDLITIDFQIRKVHFTDTSETWYLYQNDTNNQLTVFDPHEVPEGVSNPLYITCITRPFADSFPDHSIVEFSYNGEYQMFVPIRKRPDKKIPNFKTICNDNWDMIIHPVTLEDIKTFFKKEDPKEEEEDKPHDQGELESHVEQVLPLISPISPVSPFNLKRFHHFTKRCMISKLGPFTKLLDISWRNYGDDIMKWIDNNIKNVISFDSDRGSLGVAHDRLNGILAKPTIKNFNIQFIEKDLFTVPYKQDDESHFQQFEIITCHSGFHFYFTTDISRSNLHQILDLNLKIKLHGQNGGRFAGFMIDLDIIKTKKESSIPQDLSYQGVSFWSVIEFMKSCGFILEETQLAHYFYPQWKLYKNQLDHIEMSIAECYRYFVFKRIEN